MKKKPLFIIMGIFVTGLVLFSLLLILNNSDLVTSPSSNITVVPTITELPSISPSPTEKPTGAESLVVSRTRSYFIDRYPFLNTVPFKLTIETKGAPWFQEHLHGAYFFQAYVNSSGEVFTETFVYTNDTLYVMPEEFNTFISDQNVLIEDEGDALGIADFYVKAWEPESRGGSPNTIIVMNITDIPQKLHSLPENVSHLISPPSVTHGTNEFTLRFYTWTSVNGIIRQWRIILLENGTIIAENAVVSQYTGDYLFL